MKYPTMLTLTAIALGTAVYATPALHLPVQMQQKTAEVGPNSTETDQGVVDHHVKKAR